MTISIHSTATAGGAAGTGTTVTPGVISNNDILLLLHYKENTNAITYPSGFTEVKSQNSSTSDHTIYGAWKRAAGESGNYVSSWTGSVWRDAVLVAISGCALTGSPFDATTVSQANGASFFPTAPSITTATPNSMIIAFGANTFGSMSSTPPTGMSLVKNFDDVAIFSVIQAAIGASGAKTFANGGFSAQCTGMTFAMHVDTAILWDERRSRFQNMIVR